MQGDNVEKEDPVRHGFFFPVPKSRHLEKLIAVIYYSDSLFAESRIEGGKYFYLSYWGFAEICLGAKPLCTLKVNLDPSIFEELPVHVNEKGEEWRRLDYVLEMRVSSGEICWSAKYKGIEAGMVKMIVGYEGMADM